YALWRTVAGNVLTATDTTLLHRHGMRFYKVRPIGGEFNGEAAVTAYWVLQDASPTISLPSLQLVMHTLDMRSQSTHYTTTGISLPVLKEIRGELNLPGINYSSNQISVDAPRLERLGQLYAEIGLLASIRMPLLSQVGGLLPFFTDFVGRQSRVHGVDLSNLRTIIGNLDFNNMTWDQVTPVTWGYSFPELVSVGGDVYFQHSSYLLTT